MKMQTETLNEAILILREKRSKDLVLLKEQLHEIYESVKPINLIKSTVQEFTASPELRANIVGNTLGLGMGFLAKKLLVGNSRRPLKRLLGTLIQYGVANIVSKHSDTILTTGEKLMTYMAKHRNESKQETSGGIEIIQ
jgi:hypothetical protein